MNLKNPDKEIPNKCLSSSFGDIVVPLSKFPLLLVLRNDKDCYPGILQHSVTFY